MESDKLTVDTTNESQEVSPFPAGDHKAAYVLNNPGTETASKLNDSEEFRSYFEKYKAFKSEALDGAYGKTVQFWSRYMDIIQTILILIRATKENNLDLHIAALYALCPYFLHTTIASMQGMYLDTL